MILRLLYASLWGAAAWHKLRDPAAFREVLGNYRLLPPALVGPAAAVVPLLESLLCFGCLTRSQTAAAASAGLLLAYAGAIGINLLRGRREIDCGCLGTAGRQRISGLLVWRNLALAVPSMALWMTPGARVLGWLDGFTIVAAASSLGLLLAAADRLGAIAARGTGPGVGGTPR